jgi:hypothetical protein
LHSKQSSQQESIQRKSITQRHSGHFPIFAYNIGLRKLIIQTCQGRQKQLVYELPNEEFFVSFVEYRKFEDIGFYPGDLRIEMCSNFTFLTHNRDTNQMVVNFMLIDPYYYDVQIGIFKSTSSFEDPIKNKKHQDVMIKNVMYCTKKSKRDTDFEVKLLTQFTSFISQQEFKEEKNAENEDFETNFEDSEFYGSEYDDESDADAINITYEKVPLILTKKGMMYYVVSYDGMCQVKEINPKNDEPIDHLIVYEIKSEKCNGFGCSGKDFYFLDSLNQVTKLKQNKDTKLF